MGYRSHAWLRNLIVAVVLVAGVGCAVAFALSPSRSQDTASDASPAASPDGDAPQPQPVTPEVVENTSDAKKLDQGITFSGPDPAKTEDGAQAGSGTPTPDNVQRGWKWVATDDGSGGNDGGKAVYCDDAGGHLQTGSATIDGVEYYFNETTGALELGLSGSRESTSTTARRLSRSTLCSTTPRLRVALPASLRVGRTRAVVPWRRTS